MSDSFVFKGSVAELDPELNKILEREAQRQRDTIILIPSESSACDAVNEALGSSFGNVYAEGYPHDKTRRMSQDDLKDLDLQLAEYRRFSDPRYYKGVEYADVLEALTRRRAADLFAANDVDPASLYVNVQALSGAPANNAVYSALLKPGDTILGLNLNDGGHLSHGAAVNRSGMLYNSVAYFVDPETEQLDYDAIEALAVDCEPQIIVAGYSAYPLTVDWQRFRAIADRVGALFLADIAHISGLVASGVHPSPIGIADVVTTTTHKSLTGPRGAMILTHRRDLGKRIDRALFPGEQGGPHLNTMAALAVALRLAATDQFVALQKRIVANAARLAEQLEKRGVRVVTGRSENHLLLLDCKSLGEGGIYPSGDIAARILDVVGIVTNRNTIPGDPSAFRASGIRIGTVWISQLGYGEAEIDRLAEAMATALTACRSFFYAAPGGKRRRRSKVDFAALQHARSLVATLTAQTETAQIDGKPAYLAQRAAANPASDTVDIRSDLATQFVNLAFASDVLALEDEESQASKLYGPGIAAAANLLRLSAGRYQARFGDANTAQLAAEWLADLSDGYVQFSDLHAKLPGAHVVKVVASPAGLSSPSEDPTAELVTKPFYVQPDGAPENDMAALPAFSWEEPADPPMLRTGLYDTHVEMGAKMVPFGGYEMPVWYSSVSDEHAAVRTTAGLFDVTHMGVLDASGPHAQTFLNLVCTNDINLLTVGKSQYTYLLDADGNVLDDLIVYMLADEHYLLVVNASNNDKDWAWLNAVNNGEVCIDNQRPWAKRQHACQLRDLRDSQHGEDCRVDIALQGPRSTDILLALGCDDVSAARIRRLKWAGLTRAVVGGFDLIISKTGYTGEREAFELMVHPDQAPAFWNALMAAGEPMGLKACGLASRDSTRTEAGLPLYGHELAGPFNMMPAEAGFASFIKTWKPFFVGRDAILNATTKRHLIRFRMQQKGVRRPELGDPVLDNRGKIVGHVTSCAIDNDGYLLGLAYVPENLQSPGSVINIYQTGGGSRAIRVANDLRVGKRLPIPDAADVLSRFPKRK